MALPRIASQVTDSRSQVVKRAAFLDRDGVLNRNVSRDGRMTAPICVEEFHILPGVELAVRILRANGFTLIVVTNQPDVAAGRVSKPALDAMHARLRGSMPIDDIRVCPHRDEDRCLCRKPKPGMIIEAAAEYQIDLQSSFMVGDRWRDIEAGRAAGCSTILVGDPSQASSPPDFMAASLLQAVPYMIQDAAGGETNWKR